jgi:alpha-D-ribose 1-methylphosphonate 5-triphosphate synthase subunit PhnH
LDPLLDAAAILTNMLDAMTRRGSVGPCSAIQSAAPVLLTDESRRALLLEALEAQKEVLLADNASLAAMNAVVQRHLRL